MSNDFFKDRFLQFLQEESPQEAHTYPLFWFDEVRPVSTEDFRRMQSHIQNKILAETLAAYEEAFPSTTPDSAT